MNESIVNSLSVNLPPELEKLKGAGFFKEFKTKAEYHLKRSDLPQIVKDRILLEIHNNELLEEFYIMDEKDVIKGIAKYIPGFKKKDLEKIQGDLDYIFVEGKKKYAECTISSLFKGSPLILKWKGNTYPQGEADESAIAIDMMRERGKATVTADVEMTCTVSKKSATGEKLTVHLPYPSPHGGGMSAIKLISSSGKAEIAPASSPQRTACFKVSGDKQNQFSVRFTFKNTQTYMSYKDLLKASKNATPAKEMILRKQVKPADLEEKAPHYVFTPFIQALSEKIVGKTKNKTEIARKIYDYITHEYHYSFVRDYAAIESLAEYFALRGRGDCGLQASLLITLMRYNGIPARWESGICTDGDNGGMHDWAEVYFEGVGFRPVDPSVGGGERRRGKTKASAEENCEFYFGNMDPYRLIFNTDIQEPFNPPKKQYRRDPYDNQCGEAETAKKMLSGNEVRFRRIVHSTELE